MNRKINLNQTQLKIAEATEYKHLDLSLETPETENPELIVIPLEKALDAL